MAGFDVSTEPQRDGSPPKGRDPQRFDETLLRLVRVLRNQPPLGGRGMSTADHQLREDQNLIRQYRVIFERAAFSTPCVQELSLEELSRAIDDCLAALNTGAVYSRQGLILRTLAPRNDFQTPEFRAALGNIVGHMATLRRTVRQMMFHREPTAHEGVPFFMASRDLSERDAVDLMDQVDQLRNEILTELNGLLVHAGAETFALLDLSSACILRRQAHPRYGKLALRLQNPDWSMQQVHAAWVRGQAEAWVHEHSGQWNHDDWLQLRDRATYSGWAIGDAELGNLIELLKQQFQPSRSTERSSSPFRHE